MRECKFVQDDSIYSVQGETDAPIYLTVDNGRSRGDKDGDFTYISERGSSTIDYCILSRGSLQILLDFKVDEQLYSDQHPLVLTIKGQTFNEKKTKREDYNITRYRWSAEGLAMFKMKLEELREKNIPASDDLLYTFNQRILEAMSSAKITYSIKGGPRKSKPWFDEDCYDMKKLAKESLKKYRKTNRLEDRECYASSRKKYLALLDLKRKGFDNKKQEILRNAKDSKTFWKTIALCKSTSIIQGEIAIQDWLNFYRELMTTEKNLRTCNLHNVISQNYPILDTEITNADIYKEIAGLKSNKACGPDGIPNEVLKILPDSYILLLKQLYNSVMTTGKYPAIWTNSTIHPIFKNGYKNSPSNYRALCIYGSSARLLLLPDEGRYVRKLVCMLIKRSSSSHLVNSLLTFSEEQFYFIPSVNLPEFGDIHLLLYADDIAIIGCLKDVEINFNLIKDVTPVFYKARSLPFSLKNKVQNEIDRLVNSGILEPIVHANWAAPIVPVLKKDGSVRIGGDFRYTANKAIELDRYPLHRSMRSFQNYLQAPNFRRDLSQASLQVNLAEEAKVVVNINTTKGLFSYKRPAYGVAKVPYKFQRIMEGLFADLPGMACYIDAILVAGKDFEDHEHKLDLVFRKLLEKGLELNRDKFEYKRDSVEYLGFKIDKYGLIKRWSLKLAAFNYTVEFRKTSDNSNVDALSRLPLESSFREYLDEDQEMRICCDFKVTLNRFLNTAAYPLPTQQDLFAILAEGKYSSKLGLSSAYLQLEMATGTQPFLTINTHKGLFRFRRMPFGLANAPSYFQSVMDRVLAGIEGVICYIDDVLIATVSVEKHLAVLKTVFLRLEKYNIKLKKDKCKFVQREIEYLGHLIKDDGIRPLDHKVQALQKAKSPTNISELRSFLGLVNYHGKFIPNLPDLLRPLHELLHKKNCWSWTKECEEAIEKCKSSITSERVLVLYDTTLPLFWPRMHPRLELARFCLMSSEARKDRSCNMHVNLAAARDVTAPKTATSTSENPANPASPNWADSEMAEVEANDDFILVRRTKKRRLGSTSPEHAARQPNRLGEQRSSQQRRRPTCRGLPLPQEGRVYHRRQPAWFCGGQRSRERPEPIREGHLHLPHPGRNGGVHLHRRPPGDLHPAQRRHQTGQAAHPLDVKSKGDSVPAFLSFGIKCSKCGKQGHRRANCPALARQRNGSPRQAASPIDARPPPPPPPPQRPRKPAPASQHRRPLSNRRRHRPRLRRSPRRPILPNRRISSSPPLLPTLLLRLPRGPPGAGTPLLDCELTKEEEFSTSSTSSQKRTGRAQLEKHLDGLLTFPIVQSVLQDLGRAKTLDLLSSRKMLKESLRSLPDAQVDSLLELTDTTLAVHPAADSTVQRVLRRETKAFHLDSRQDLCLGYNAVVLTHPVAIPGSGLASVFGPGVAVLRQRVLWPGHIALAVIDVHGEEMTIINAHLAHRPRERLEQLELLAATAIQEGAWVLGDLNIREPSSSSADALAALLDLAALVDVATQFDAAHLPTRVASRGDQIESSRLDRILVPAGFLDRVTTYAASHYHLSDHRLVLPQVGPPAVSYHQPRLAAMLRSGLALEHLAGYIRELEEALAHDDDDGILLWDRWTTIKAGLLAEARSLHDPRHAASDGYVVRARGYIAAQLEASSIRADYPSLRDLARAIHLRRPVSVIKDDDDNVIEGPELRRKAYAIFQPRFARPTSDPAAGAAFICKSMITPISELGEEDPLQRPEICPSEIAAAIRRLPRGKAPGWDGLPCELLAAFEDLFAEALARVFAASRLRGALPPSTRRSSICLVPKARGGRGLEEYRPIALPSADYRVLAAILHRRLKPHLRALVPDCQTYAVPGRSPSWNIAKVTDAVEETTAMGSPLAVMGVDLESAFDSLDRGFLESLMTSLRLPPAFMGWINILYAGADATIRAGGSHTTAYPLLNGLRQGCASGELAGGLHHPASPARVPAITPDHRQAAGPTSVFVWGPEHTAWLPAAVMARPVAIGGLGLLDLATQLQLACLKGVQVALRGGRNGFDWLVASSSEAWIRPPPDGTRLQPRRLRLLKLWEEASKILSLNHQAVPTSQLLDILIIGGCRFLRPPDLLAPARWLGVRVRDFLAEDRHIARPTRSALADAAALGAFCRRLTAENDEGFQETSLAAAVVLRGTATPFLNGLTTRSARRALDRPNLAATPISRFLARWAPTISPPSRIDWASLRRCAFSGHEADAAFKLALHALSHQAHPASADSSCPACGSVDRSLGHRYWSCSSIRPLIRETFNIIGRPPDLQAWIFGGSSLEDDALTILASAKLHVYRHFVQVGLVLFITQYNRMNSHYIVGLATKDLARRLVEGGLEIEGTTLRVFPYRKRAERIIVANLPGFVEDSAVVNALSPYGKVTSIAPILVKMGEFTFTDGRRRPSSCSTTASNWTGCPPAWMSSPRETPCRLPLLWHQVLKMRETGPPQSQLPSARQARERQPQASSVSHRRKASPPPPSSSSSTAKEAGTCARNTGVPCPTGEDIGRGSGDPLGAPSCQPKDLAQPAPAAHPAPPAAPRPPGAGTPLLDCEMTNEEEFSTSSTPSQKCTGRAPLEKHLDGLLTLPIVQSVLQDLGRAKTLDLLSSRKMLKESLRSLPDAQVVSLLELTDTILAAHPAADSTVQRVLTRPPRPVPRLQRCCPKPSRCHTGIWTRLRLRARRSRATTVDPVAGPHCLGNHRCPRRGDDGHQRPSGSRPPREEPTTGAPRGDSGKGGGGGLLDLRRLQHQGSGPLFIIIIVGCPRRSTGPDRAGRRGHPVRRRKPAHQSRKTRRPSRIQPPGPDPRPCWSPGSRVHLRDQPLPPLGPPPRSAPGGPAHHRRLLPTQPRLAAMLRSGLALEHLAGYIRELEEDTAHDDDDGTFWDRARRYIAARLEASSIRADYPSLPDLARAIRLRRPVSVIRDEEDNVIEGPELRQRAFANFQPRFARPTSDPAAGAVFIASSAPTTTRELSEEDPLHRSDISPSEIAHAIKHLPRGKAPGWDGLPCELLVAFNEDFFAEALARVFAASRLRGALPPSTRRSFICLVPAAQPPTPASSSPAMEITGASPAARAATTSTAPRPSPPVAPTVPMEEAPPVPPPVTPAPSLQATGGPAAPRGPPPTQETLRPAALTPDVEMSIVEESSESSTTSTRNATRNDLVAFIESAGSWQRRWSFQMKLVLIENDLWSLINPGEAKPDPSDLVATKLFLSREGKTFAKICLGINDEQQLHVQHLNTPKEVWEELEKLYAPKDSRYRAVQLRRQLYGERLTQHSNMEGYMGKINYIVNELAQIGDKIDDGDLAMVLLGGLPEDWDTVVSTICNLPDSDFITATVKQKQNQKGVRLIYQKMWVPWSLMPLRSPLKQKNNLKQRLFVSNVEVKAIMQGNAGRKERMNKDQRDQEDVIPTEEDSHNEDTVKPSPTRSHPMILRNQRNAQNSIELLSTEAKKPQRVFCWDRRPWSWAGGGPGPPLLEDQGAKAWTPPVTSPARRSRRPDQTTIGSEARRRQANQERIETYANSPAGERNVNLAAPFNLAANSSSNGVADAQRNWADYAEDVNPGADDCFTVVKGRKRRRDSPDLPAMAAQSNSARASRRHRPLTGWIPRVQEIRSTGSHVMEASARQASCTKEQCCYLEYCPDYQTYQYMRAIEKTAASPTTQMDALSRYGRISSIAPKQLRVGEFEFTDGRREAFILLHDGVTIEKLPTRFEIKIKGEAWPAYLTYGIKCSRCHGQGHRRANCPLLHGQSSTSRRASPPSTNNLPPSTAPGLPRRSSAAPPAPAPPSPAVEASGAPPAARAALLPSTAPRPSTPAPPASSVQAVSPASPVTPAPEDPVGPRSAVSRYLEPTPPARPDPVAPPCPLPTQETLGPAVTTQDVEMTVVEEATRSSASSIKKTTRDDLVAFIKRNPSVSFAGTDALGISRVSCATASDPAMEVSGVLPAAPAAPHRPAVSRQPPPAPTALPMDVSTPAPAPPAPSQEKLSDGPTAHTAPRPAEPTPPTTHKEESTPALVTPPPPLLPPIEEDLSMEREGWVYDIFNELYFETVVFNCQLSYITYIHVISWDLWDLCYLMLDEPRYHLYRAVVVEGDTAGPKWIKGDYIMFAVLYPEYRKKLLKVPPEHKGILIDFIGTIIEHTRDDDQTIQDAQTRPIRPRGVGETPRWQRWNPTTATPSSETRRGASAHRHLSTLQGSPKSLESSAAPSSRSGQQGLRKVPPQEIKATRKNIAEAKARQNSSTHENYIFVELCPEIPDYTYLQAMSKLVGGPKFITQFNRMNGHYIVGLESKDLANRLVVDGLEIEGTSLRVFPFRKRAERIVVANLPGFVEDFTVVNGLSPYGKVTSIAPILVKMGEFTFTDGRREAFILLKDSIKLDRLPTRLDIQSKGDSLPAFLTFGIKCSKCGKQGHRRANCPTLARQTISSRQTASTTDVRPPSPPPPPPPQQPRQPSPAPAAPASPVPPAETSTKATAIPSAPQPAEPKDHAQPAPAAHPAPLAPPRPPGARTPLLDCEMTNEEEFSTSSTSSQKRIGRAQLEKHLDGLPTLPIVQSVLQDLGRAKTLDLLSSRKMLKKDLASLPAAQVASLLELTDTILAAHPDTNSTVQRVLRRPPRHLPRLQHCCPDPSRCHPGIRTRLRLRARRRRAMTACPVAGPHCLGRHRCPRRRDDHHQGPSGTRPLRAARAIGAPGGNSDPRGGLGPRGSQHQGAFVVLRGCPRRSSGPGCAGGRSHPAGLLAEARSLHDLRHAPSDGYVVRARGYIAAQLEASSIRADYPSLPDLARAIHLRRPVRVISDDDDNVIEGPELRQKAYAIFQPRFARPTSDPATGAAFIGNSMITPISELGEEDPLHRPEICPSEIAAAIRRLPLGKAPGWDGLPCELLAAFEDFFAEALARVFAASRRHGSAEPCLRRRGAAPSAWCPRPAAVAALRDTAHRTALGRLQGAGCHSPPAPQAPPTSPGTRLPDVALRGGRNGFDWLVATSSEDWIRPPPDRTRLQPRRLRLLKLWEEASKILSLNHRAVPTSQLLDIPIIGGCRFLRPPDLLAPARWRGARVRDLLAEGHLIARPTRSVLADAAALSAFCRRLTSENAVGFGEESSSSSSSLAAVVVLRGTATPFLNGLTTRSARRALDRPRLAATPISRFIARWTPTIAPPSRIDWASLRRCAFSGHEADAALKLALHALPHPAHDCQNYAVPGRSLSWNIANVTDAVEEGPPWARRHRPRPGVRLRLPGPRLSGVPDDVLSPPAGLHGLDKHPAHPASAGPSCPACGSVDRSLDTLSPAMEVSDLPPTSRAALHPPAALRQSPPRPSALPAEDAPPAPPPVIPAPSLRALGSREPAAPTPDIEMSIVEETSTSSTSSSKTSTREGLVTFIERNPGVSFAGTDALGLGREEVLELLSSKSRERKQGPLLSPPQSDALAGLIGQLLNLRPGGSSNIYKVLGQVSLILTCKTSKQIWASLTKIYEGDIKKKSIEARNNVSRLRMYLEESWKDYLHSSENLLENARIMGATIDDEEFIYSVIKGLPQKYNIIAMQINTMNNPTLSDIESQFSLYQERYHEKDFSSSSAYKASQSESKKFYPKNKFKYKPECYICNKIGHKANDCWHNQKNKGNNNRREDLNKPSTSGYKPKFGNQQKQTGKSHNEKAANCLIAKNQEKSEKEWIIDSGATSHMTSCFELLKNSENKENKIILADDTQIESKAIGNVIIKTKEENLLILKDVLFVPQIKGNLLKAYRICNPEKFQITETRDVTFLENQKGAELLTSIEQDSIDYSIIKIDGPAEEETNSSSGDEESSVEIQNPASNTRYNFRHTHRPGFYYEPSLSEEEYEENSIIQAPNDTLLMTQYQNHIPKTYKEAIECPQASKWTEAMKREINYLLEHHVWDIEPLPKGTKPIKSKWIFTIKYDSIIRKRYKARLVAAGYSQKYGIDYYQTFSPVIKIYKEKISNGRWDQAFLFTAESPECLRCPRMRSQVDARGSRGRPLPGCVMELCSSSRSLKQSVVATHTYITLHTCITYIHTYSAVRPRVARAPYFSPLASGIASRMAASLVRAQSPSKAENRPVRHGMQAQPCAELTAKQDLQKQFSNSSCEDQRYANPPTGVRYANLAAARGDVTTGSEAATSSNGAARVLGNWADYTEDPSPGADEDFTVIKSRKRRRNSADSPTAAKHHSNPRGAGANSRPRSSTGWVPRAEEIKTTRAHIAEARARQASSAEDNCVYVEYSPEFEPYHYIRAVDRMIGGTNNVFQVSKINGHYLMGLNNRGQAERLISEGLEVEGTLFRAFPFRKRAMKITVGNLPFFVEDSNTLRARNFNRAQTNESRPLHLQRRPPRRFHCPPRRSNHREAPHPPRDKNQRRGLARIPVLWYQVFQMPRAGAPQGQLPPASRASQQLQIGPTNLSCWCPINDHLCPTSAVSGPASCTGALQYSHGDPRRFSRGPSCDPICSTSAIYTSGLGLPMEMAPPAPPPVTPAPSLRAPGSHEPAAPTPDIEMSIVEETSTSSTSSSKTSTRESLVTFIERNPGVSFAQTDALGLGREEVLDILSSKTKARKRGPLLSPSQGGALAGLIRQLLGQRPGGDSNIYKVLRQVLSELRTAPTAVPSTPPLPAPRPAEPTPPAPQRRESASAMAAPQPPPSAHAKVDPVPDRWKVLKIRVKEAMRGPLSDFVYDTSISVNDIVEVVQCPEKRDSLLACLSPKQQILLPQFLEAVIEHTQDMDPSLRRGFQTLNIVLQQGFPKRLLSDRAPAFTSEKIRKFLITHGIQPLLTTSNNPQANGLIKRLNATITGKLRLAYLENPKASWTQLVERVTQTYNNTLHSFTSFPPTYLMFNVIHPDIIPHLNPYHEINITREIARSRTQNKHKKDEETFDKQHKAPHFEVNDLVLVKNYRHPDTGKLAPYFTGPYTIIEIISPNVVRIDRPNQSLNRDSDTIHFNKLKYCTERMFCTLHPHKPDLFKTHSECLKMYISSMKKTRSNTTMIEQTHNQVPQEPTTDSTVAASLRTLTLCLDQLLNRESEETITYDGDEPAAHFFSQLESQPNFHNLEPARQARKSLSSLRGEPRKIAQDLALLNKTYEEVKESLCAVYPRRPTFTLQEFYELKCTSMAEIETYYKNKVRIGLAINLPKSAIVQALSNGVPRNYGNLLKMAQPSGPEEWLCLAQQLTYEGDNTSTKAAQQRSPRQSRTPSTTVDKTPTISLPLLWRTTLARTVSAATGPYQRTFRTFTPAVHSVEQPQRSTGPAGVYETAATTSSGETKTPINVKTLQSFLGAVNVYHKFIPEYARLRHPLNQLLKKNAKWLWSPNCQQAFDKLKQHLATQPVLHLFQEGLPCQVYCDASTQGIAGVLKQGLPDGNIYPVQYYSRALRSYERNYTISELECLAIVECVDKFRVYLLGTRFVIYSDHHALQWLKTIKDPTGRLFRWRAFDSELTTMRSNTSRARVSTTRFLRIPIHRLNKRSSGRITEGHK
ncbi:K02A2.6-like, partial [Cordylochernes scorpioides]